MAAPPPLPAELVAKLEQAVRERWTGTVSLNFKDGRVLGWSETERHRASERSRP